MRLPSHRLVMLFLALPLSPLVSTARAQLGVTNGLSSSELGGLERDRGTSTGERSRPPQVGDALHPIPRMDLPSAASIDARARKVDPRWGSSGDGAGAADSWRPVIGGYNESQARAIIGANGYKNITGLEAGPDGSWHGLAHYKTWPRGVMMRVTLSRGGSVSAR